MSQLVEACRHTRLADRRIIVALACATAALAAGTADAHAATAGSCRASAARVAVPPAATVEPTVANTAASPCITDSARVAGIAPLGPISATAPTATTQARPGVYAAAASIEQASLSLGLTPISVGAVAAQQMVSCSNGRNVAAGSSHVDALTIGGTAVPVVAGQQLDVSVAGIRVRTNQLAGDTRQALVLTLGANEVVLGEATAAGDACATLGSGGGTGGGGGSTGGSGAICPTGSTYQVDGNVCVITQTNGKAIVIGPPYAGPNGGTVIAVSRARSLVKAGRMTSSACLSGAGKAYAILGTKRRDRLTGTNGSDRIIALGGNDRVDGGRGNDCLDGGTGGDALSGGAGADRLIGASGVDHLNGGPDSDRLTGGTGNDTINTAFGADQVSGNAGNDAINASTNGPAARINGGAGRDIIRINRNERRRTKNAETVYVIR